MRTKLAQRSIVIFGAALAAAVLFGASAEAADRAVEPGTHRHVHRYVRVRDCVDDRAAVKPTKYVRRCAIVSDVPWDSGLRLQWWY
jgi:hypothetical protein